MKLTREEFDTIALEHLDMLYRVARRLCGDPTQAEDLVQETYLRAYRARSEFKLEEFGIRPWLVRIMHNLHVSRAMREKRQPISVDDTRLEGTAANATSISFDPTNFQGMDERLVRAVEALPQEYQTVLVLWAIEQFSYKEIAQAVGVPMGTVMSRLHRARARLSETLADFAKKERIIRE